MVTWVKLDCVEALLSPDPIIGERQEVCLMEQPEIPQKEGSLSERISQEFKWVQIAFLATYQRKITTAVLGTRDFYSNDRV